MQGVISGNYFYRPHYLARIVEPLLDSASK